MKEILNKSLVADICKIIPRESFFFKKVKKKPPGVLASKWTRVEPDVQVVPEGLKR